MVKLSVNLNKIALLRNSRETSIPDVPAFSRMAIGAGAQGITVHPRPDLRHITPADCYLLGENLDVEFNIEGNPFAAGNAAGYPGFMEIVRRVRPDQCTLVPDSEGQKTSDHGWDCVNNLDRLRPVVEELQGLGSRVSVFLDPVLEQVHAAAALGVDRIELYTEPFARAFERGEGALSFEAYSRASELANALGIGVNAGHDLNLDNLGLFSALPGLLEVSIGHALVVDGLIMGFKQAIESYLTCLDCGL